MPSKSHRKRWMKILVIAILATVVIGGGVLFGVRRYYNENLKPVSSTEQLQEFTIPVGSALPEIAESLKEAISSFSSTAGLKLRKQYQKTFTGNKPFARG